MPDDGSAPLVLARADLAALMHNDRVEVLAVGMNERGRRIARLIRRTADAPKRIGGVWRAVLRRGSVAPEDPGHWYTIDVSMRDRHGAKDGDEVIVELTKRPQGEPRRMAASSNCSITCGPRIWRRASRFSARPAAGISARGH